MAAQNARLATIQTDLLPMTQQQSRAVYLVQQEPFPISLVQQNVFLVNVVTNPTSNLLPQVVKYVLQEHFQTDLRHANSVLLIPIQTRMERVNVSLVVLEHRLLLYLENLHIHFANFVHQDPTAMMQVLAILVLLANTLLFQEPDTVKSALVVLNQAELQIPVLLAHQDNILVLEELVKLAQLDSSTLPAHHVPVKNVLLDTILLP